MKSQIETFLQDMSYNSTFRFLEQAKDKDKLLEIAEKRDIVLPAHDLAIFECIYAFTDRQNKNGCTLEKSEVEKALKTIVGKSIDLDHLRQNVVGHWLDAKLDGDKIIAYGAIFKSSFKEDYKIVKELFDKGNLSVSFEAWGTRNYNEDYTGYNLTDIEFAGGALLLKEEPAFEGADVLELAKKERVLEFAKVMVAPKEFVHNKEEKDLEDSKYYVYDNQAIIQALNDVECSSCKEKHMMDISFIDYENNKVKTKCLYCSAEMMIDMTPKATLTKKGRKVKKMEDYVTKCSVENINNIIEEYEGSSERLELLLDEAISPNPKLDYSSRFDLTDEDFAVVKNINKEKGQNLKIRIIPIHDLAHIDFAKKKINTEYAKALFQKLNISKDNVERKISRREITIAMKNLLEKYNKGSVQEVIQEIAKASINRELSKEELEKAYNLVELKGTSTSNATSVQTAGGTTPANDVHAHSTKKADTDGPSVLKASITEEDVKLIITEATKKPETVTTVAKIEDVEVSKKLEEATSKLVELTKQLEEATKKLEAFEKSKKDAEEAEKASTIKSRRDELGDFAKDLSDEDMLNEAKYALAKVAKLEKENADLKVASTKGKEKVDLTKGSDDKTENPEQASRNLVNQYAYKNSK